MKTGKQKRVLIIGLGDLGKRIAHVSASLLNDTEIILAGRASAKNTSFTNLVSICCKKHVRFVSLDVSNQKAVEKLLRGEAPDVIVHCASLLSPWYISSKGSSPACGILRKVGFAAQLPAQLPLIATVMKAVREIGHQAPVINCSYPDVVNPILACFGLEPSVGTGNAAMITAKVEAALKMPHLIQEDSRDYEAGMRVRIIAHHAHVTNVMLSRLPRNKNDMARVYIGEKGIRDDRLAYSGLPVKSNVELNSITAMNTVSLIRALLPDGKLLRTSAPSPFGLPGGYPVSIRSGKITLDLPDGVEMDEVIKYQQQNARHDGIKEIGSDGTVFFTERLKKKLTEIDKRLAEPLSLGDSVRRFRILKKYL